MADSKEQPIIIKKIKKGGGGHHGGAWKVAYADFVTAMMAFFLLLWLLGSTSKATKEGLAEYFTPTMGIKDSMGIGFKGGLKPTEKGTSKSDLTTPGVVAGQAPGGPISVVPDNTLSKNVTDEINPAQAAPPKPKDDDAKAEDDKMKATEEEIKKAFEEAPELQPFKENVLLNQTPEGLKIDIVDEQGRSMFVPGGPELSEVGKKLLAAVAPIIKRTPNNISVIGHTDGSVYPPGSTYTSWELSADRANASRRFLATTALEPERIMKITGMADKDLLLPQEPQSPRNRRITLLIMRDSFFTDTRTNVGKSILSVPNIRNPINAPAAKGSTSPDVDKQEKKLNEAVPELAH